MLIGELQRDGIDELTPRQLDVLRLMAEGHSNAAICRRLFLSPRTVEGHINQIFLTLGVNAQRAAHPRVLVVLAYLDRTRAPRAGNGREKPHHAPAGGRRPRRLARSTSGAVRSAAA